jgi:hypothetical protein
MEQSKKKKKPSLLQRKTKKIEAENAKLIIKADAFRAKLASGYTPFEFSSATSLEANDGPNTDTRQLSLCPLPDSV